MDFIHRISVSHKVHPKIFRIKNINDWDSRGIYGKEIAKFLEEDFKIRETLKRKLKDCGVERIEIERFPDKITVIISSARPGLIIGRGGAGTEDIKRVLAKEVYKNNKKIFPKDLKIEVREIKDVFAHPSVVAEWISQRLEKRMPFRRVIKQALEKVMETKGVKGARIGVAGRLGGTEIARAEWVKKGNLPRQTIRADIDYGVAEARCSYGTIGIKVLIYKGEKLQ